MNRQLPFQPLQAILYHTSDPDGDAIKENVFENVDDTPANNAMEHNVEESIEEGHTLKKNVENVIECYSIEKENALKNSDNTTVLKRVEDIIGRAL